MAVKKLLWNGFESSLLDSCIFRGPPNEITTSASPEGAETGPKSVQSSVALVEITLKR